MHANYIRIIISLFLISFNLSTLQAQIVRPWFEIGFFSGGSSYLGDLNTDNYFKFEGLTVGALAKYNIDDRQAAKISFTYTELGGNDRTSDSGWQQRRNLSFFSPVFDLTASYELSFFEYNPVSYSNKFLSPYLGVGITILHFDPQTYLNGVVYHLSDYHTEGQDLQTQEQEQKKSYKLWSWALPITLGVKYNLTRQLNIFSELIYKLSGSDYLDDVSTYYPTNVLDNAVGEALADRSPELGYEPNLPGSQRGDLSKKDSYIFVNFGITINFGEPKCIGPYNF